MLTLTGLCKGYYSNTRTIRGANGESQITEHSILVMVEEPNKYGMVEEKVKEVRLSKKHMDAGMHNIWNQLKDKPISAPVFVQTWASKAGNSGFDLWLSGDGKPLPVQQIKPAPVAAAS